MKISYLKYFSLVNNILIFKVFIFIILTIASYANYSHILAQYPILAIAYSYIPLLLVNTILLTTFSLIIVV